jgi:hypothetical protein
VTTGSRRPPWPGWTHPARKLLGPESRAVTSPPTARWNGNAGAYDSNGTSLPGSTYRLGNEREKRERHETSGHHPGAWVGGLH